MKRKHYEAAMAPLREQLVVMARWARTTGQRIVVLFEGRDTAGKGGAIRAVSEKLNPRQCHIVALAKPTEAEQTQWYFQRYVDHLPSAGEIVLFDRSWYNRAGVEKVMSYADDAQVARFLEQAPAFEKMLVDDGILLFKYWLGRYRADRTQRGLRPAGARRAQGLGFHRGRQPPRAGQRQRVGHFAGPSDRRDGDPHPRRHGA